MLGFRRCSSVKHLTAEQLQRVLDAIGGSAVRGDIETELSTRDLVNDPVVAVQHAIDRGILVEDGACTWGPVYTVAADTEHSESSISADKNPEEAGSGTTNPTPDDDTNRSNSTRGTDSPNYRELYLTAHEKTDDDRPWIPHETIQQVFTDYGFSDIVEVLKHTNEWIVWTPESRETPLYAYSPDLAGDTSREREQIAELLADAGAGTERFINVLDGQKASFDTGNFREPGDSEIYGNYGVKGGRGGDADGYWLIDIDVDDYDAAKESNKRVEELRDDGTLAVASAHTTTERPGHLYVLVQGDPRQVVREVLGREVDNPVASFGEIRLDEQYVLGPGSEIVCACDRCTAEDAPDHLGCYEIANERPPVVWSEEDFREFLKADPAITQAKTSHDTGTGDAGEGRGNASSVNVNDDAGDRLSFAKTVDDYVASALQDARNPDDRSQADAALARAVAPWVGYNENDIRNILDQHGTEKWAERTDQSYRGSVLDYATSRGVDSYDTVPYWAVVEYAVAEGIVDTADLVYRDSETGDVVEDHHKHDSDVYRALPDREAYETTLQRIEDAGVEHGREIGDTPGHIDFSPDPLELDVVYEPRDAWRAAGQITPDDVAPELGLPTTDDKEAWLCPVTEDRIRDVVRAVAISDGDADDRREASDLDGRAYFDHYNTARTRYGAPLPVYIDAERVVDDLEATRAAVENLKCWHILDNLESEITVDNPTWEPAIAKLDPTWEDSESGERIIALDSGSFWCAKHDQVIDPFRVVALEQGLIDEEDAYPSGDTYLDTYEIARTAYDAPLPRVTWIDNDRSPDADHEVVLPPAEDLLGEFTTDRESLDAARDDNEELYRELARDRSSADLLTTLPALGKSTSAVKAAATTPTLLLSPRRELQQEYVNKANEHGVTSYVLPVFAEPWEGVSEEAALEALGIVREDGLDVLRERNELIDRLEMETDPGDPGADTVILDRATCSTAAGEHGDAWALVVSVAHRLGLAPQTIHENAEHLFGEDLPCCNHDEDEEEHDHQEDPDCPYQAAWNRVADPDRPVDLLIGSRVHGHVESARTWYSRSENDAVTTDPRNVVIDEFPGDDFGNEWGDNASQVATWLAETLVADIKDETDAQRRADELASSWVWDWLSGDASEDDCPLTPLHARVSVAEALVPLYEQLDSLRSKNQTPAVEALLDAVRCGDLGSAEDLVTLVEAVSADIGALDLGEEVAKSVNERVSTLVDALSEISGSLTRLPNGADPAVGEKLLQFVEEAFEPLRHGVDPDEIDAYHAAATTACTVLEGGRDAVRELVVRARHPYAHPDASLLLAGMIADEKETTVVELTHYGFDPDRERTRVTRVEFDGATILWDRNGAGAYVLDPPAFRSHGRSCSVVGLDATGRERLWNLAIGEDMNVQDIHDTPDARKRFLRNVLNVQLVCTDQTNVNTYSGSPAGKNFDDDEELVRAIADEYGGGQLRQDTLSAATKPGLITTRKVLDAEGDRFSGHVGATANYWDVTGSNALSQHNIGIVLGAPHTGHAVVERWAALAGEEIDTEGHGLNLDYNSNLANTFLKYIREDQVMQAVLRFGRDEEGALVFAHTAALRDDLPVEGDGVVATAYSRAGKAVRNAVLPYLKSGAEFTVSDIAGEVSHSRRSVQRKLAEFDRLGYIDRIVGGGGRTNVFEVIDDPGVGHVDLPEGLDGSEQGENHDNSCISDIYTGIVGVRKDERGEISEIDASAPTLPGMEAAPVADTDPPPG